MEKRKTKQPVIVTQQAGGLCSVVVRGHTREADIGQDGLTPDGLVAFMKSLPPLNRDMHWRDVDHRILRSAPVEYITAFERADRPLGGSADCPKCGGQVGVAYADCDW
jgi:hypothetical protein